MHRHIKHIMLASSLYVLLQPNYSFAATIEDLTPYRGVYDLQLNDANEKSGITGFSGRMVYEFSGNECAGFTTKFRFVSNVDFNELPRSMSDQQVTTFESADSKKFNFSNKNFVNGKLSKEVTGNGELHLKGLKINITKPEVASYNLKQAKFPKEHTLAIINHALDKNYIFHANIFDGSEDANKTIPTNVIIGKQITPKADDETKIMGKLANQPAWPVSIAYYDDGTNPNGLPVYNTNFLLYANGIARDLIMDYGDFSIKGKLIKLEILPKPTDKCEAQNTAKK